MTTPYFPDLRAQFAALGRRSIQSLRQATLFQLGQNLRELIPVHLLASEDDGPNSRDRAFPLRLTCECFIWQMLNPGASYREVVRHVQALGRLLGHTPVDEGTSAYVQARQRVPEERLEKVMQATATAADRRAGAGGCLQGRPIKVVDGSTTQLADTPENQLEYPQPSTQKKGCGFPVMKLAVLFSLTSGAVLHVLTGNLHRHDLRLFRQMWDCLKSGDILMGDRAYQAAEKPEFPRNDWIFRWIWGGTIWTGQFPRPRAIGPESLSTVCLQNFGRNPVVRIGLNWFWPRPVA